MSSPNEQPIVIHPKVHGDPERVANPNAVVETPAPPPPPPAPAPPRAERRPVATDAARPHVERARGLDAVRGLCLLGMNYAFAIPFAVLPAWMYHMQNPPPTGEYVSLPGLTWQDIIFPGFVFAMAAAVPIRAAQLLERGVPGPRIAWEALKRALLLYFFALIIGHVNPYYTEYYSRGGNMLAIVGFVTCFALFLRRREEWDPQRFQWLRRAGWVAAVAILAASPLLWGGTFSLLRRDHIISAIAFTYVISTFVWLLTRTSVMARLAILAMVVVFKLLAPLGGIFGMLLGRSAAPAIYEPWYIELLVIAIPGLIAGDLLRDWLRDKDAVDTPELAGQRRTRHRPRFAAAAILGFAVMPVLLVGLYQRWLPMTTFVAIGLVALGAVVLEPLRKTPQRRLTWIGAWAGALIVIGMLLEPLEGGIKKDPQTLGFLVLSAGIFFAALLAATIILDVMRGPLRHIATPIVVAGQNAMLAYVLFMLFYNPLAYLIGIGDALTATPGQAYARGALYTALVLATLWAATRKRFVWRA